MVDDIQSNHKLAHKKIFHRLNVEKYYISSPPLNLFVNKTNVPVMTLVNARKVFYNCAPIVHRSLEKHNSISQCAVPDDPCRKCEDGDIMFDVVTDQPTDFVAVNQEIINLDRQTITEPVNDQVDENYSDSDSDDDFVLIDNNDHSCLSGLSKLERLLRYAT